MFKQNEGESSIESSVNMRGSTMKMRDFKKKLLNKKIIQPNPIVQNNTIRNIVNDS